MDVESLQHSGRRRGRCLDVCLVVSVCLLFVAVGAVAAGGVMIVMDLRSKLEVAGQSLGHGTRSVGHGTLERQSGVTAAPAYKMQNFAYLQAKSSRLGNGTMTWSPIYYGQGQSIGSHFYFDAAKHALQPTLEGSYFMYFELKLTCNHKCTAGLLTLRLDNELTCNVELPERADKTPVNRKCWTVARMDGQKQLITQMTVPKEGLENWILDLNSSGLGMFLVG